MKWLIRHTQLDTSQHNPVFDEFPDEWWTVELYDYKKFYRLGSFRTEREARNRLEAILVAEVDT